MSRKLSVLAFALLLSSCAYTTEGSVHELTVRTPGANNAVCNVYVEKLRYQFYPPETRTIFRSDENLIVDCLAPGGRRQKVVIEPKISQAANWNVVNGVAPGILWDYASETMFVYPSEVEVDFTGAPIVAPEPPAQNSPDVRQPETYDLEEFSAGSPRLNSDKYRQEIVPQRRQPYGGFGDTGSIRSNGSGLNESRGTVPPTSNDYQAGGKGDLMDVISRTGASVTATNNDTAAVSDGAQGNVNASGAGSLQAAPQSNSFSAADNGASNFTNGSPPMPMVITPDRFGPSEAQ